ncbi:MAG TPA: hypothetical protein VK559_11800 [Ferruginibacter sp.]|nr:hypothetical protein [Ferruginibacter sp.]
MSNNLNWHFVSTGGGDEDGINNSKIEYFSGDYNYYLARETIQNSIDARNDKSQPVEVIFKLNNFSAKDFPGFIQINEVLQKGIDYWVENPETKTFLNSAKKYLTQKEIPFLRISDYNTIGLSGSDSDKKGGWYSLVKSTGNSSKASGEGGSFGIGKGAPFAASNLRMVFYATKNESAVSIFQGKAELVSFKDNDEDIKRGVGSYGINQNSVRNLKEIPEMFWRKQQGTDIIIAGYKVTEDWIEDLIKSILRNFWYAIYKDDLIVQVEEKKINKKNLESYLIDFFATEPFKDYIQPVGNPLQYYLAVKEGNELGENRKLEILGNCKFYFRQIESPMNYVAMIRASHMVIYSRQFVFPGNYAGVFICDDDAGNKLLRKMEPPEHDKWEPKRDIEKGEKIISEITVFIRECLNKLKENQTYEILEIPELQKYLPYDEEEDEDGGGNESDNGSYTGNEGKVETSNLIQKKEQFNQSALIIPTKISVINTKTNFGGNEDGEGGDNKGKAGKKKAGGGDGNKNTRKKKHFHVRSFLFKESMNELTYKLILLSPTDTKCTLKILAVGEEGSEPIRLKNVFDDEGTRYLFSGNKIQHFKFEKGVTKELKIMLESPIKISLNVEAHDIQQ